jgi:hypothetical protein
VEERRERRPAPHVEGTHALGRAQLVPGQRQQVHRQLAHVDGQAAERLHGVGVHDDAPCAGAGGHRLDRLHHARLVVHPHERAHGDGVVEQRLRCREIDHAVGVHREQARRGALGRRVVDRCQHRLVLDRGRHDRRPALATVGAPRAEHREVVGLGPARGEHHLVGPRAERGGEPIACLVERRAGGTPPPVRARRIAELRPVERLHRRSHLGPHGRGRGMVEIDGRSGHGWKATRGRTRRASTW